MVSEPPTAQKPTATSRYDLTSIMATSRKLLGMPDTPLTARDAWAATFEQALSLAEPRTDCSMHMPAAPKPVAPPHTEASLPLNELQRQIGAVQQHLATAPAHARAQSALLEATPPAGDSQRHHGTGASRHHEMHETRQRSLRSAHAAAWMDAWQRYPLIVRSLASPQQLDIAKLPAEHRAPSAERLAFLPWVEKGWLFSPPHPNLPWSTISSLTLKVPALNGTGVPSAGTAKVPVCLDFGGQLSHVATAGAVVGVAPCGPGDGSAAHDASQRWSHGTDNTIRPYAAPGLCLTNHMFDTYDSAAPAVLAPTAVTLESCEHRVSQSWAYHALAPGQPEANFALLFGDGANALGLVQRDPPRPL